MNASSSSWSSPCSWGSYILAFFGLSLPIVQVAGGLLIMSFGWTFLHQQEEAAATPSAQTWRPEELATRAFYPLTLPLTVGPGGISVAITLGANTSQAGLYHGALVVAMVTGVALVALSIYLCYRFAENIARVLGRTGTSVSLAPVGVHRALHRRPDPVERPERSRQVADEGVGSVTAELRLRGLRGGGRRGPRAAGSRGPSPTGAGRAIAL